MLEWLFGSRKTPEQELQEAKSAIAQLRREYERDAQRYRKKSDSAYILGSNALHDGNATLARSYMRDQVANDKISQAYQQEARALSTEALGLDKLRAHVVINESMGRVSRAVRRVLGAANMEEFQKSVQTQQMNMEKLSLRRELLSETLAGDEDIETETNDEAERMLAEEQERIDFEMLKDAPSVKKQPRGAAKASPIDSGPRR